jgi:Fur family peroxide stress response transcriptional regulator
MLDKNKQNSMALFKNRCKRYNLNVTPQRIAIYQELIKAKNHPDAEDVFERIKTILPEISLDTVYRTLAKFTEIGLINLVEGYGEAKRYDPDTGNHHHFRCRKCNKIVDFQNKTYDNLKIPKTFQRNFKVTNVKVLLEGTCDKCARKS